MTAINEKIAKAIHCLDEYMIHAGKHEIDEMEANRELARVGVLQDEASHPGEPLRQLLTKMRDANSLPQNIKQRYGAWKIKISGTMATRQTIVGIF